MSPSPVLTALGRLTTCLDNLDTAVDQAEKKIKMARKAKAVPQLDLFAAPAAANTTVMASEGSHLNPDMVADRLARAIAQLETVLDQAA